MPINSRILVGSSGMAITRQPFLPAKAKVSGVLVAAQLQTKYLNDVFVVARGQYTELGPLLIWAVALGFIIPIAAIALFGRRVVTHVAKK